MTQKINVYITKERLRQLPWEQYEIMEAWTHGEEPMLRDVRQIVSQFMVDERGVPIPVEEAFKMLGQVQMGEAKEVVQKFTGALKGSAVPPKKRKRSSRG